MAGATFIEIEVRISDGFKEVDGLSFLIVIDVENEEIDFTK